MGNKSSSDAAPEQLTNQEIAMLKSASEIRDHYDGFKLLCPSGKMDKKTMVDIWGLFYGDKIKKVGGCDYIFNAFDKNHDDHLDFKEFILAGVAADKNDVTSRLEFVFDMIDTSGDHLMSYDELVTFVAVGSKLSEGLGKKPEHIDPKQAASNIFSRLGVNEGQKITKQQFVEGCKKDPTLSAQFESA